MITIKDLCLNVSNKTILDNITLDIENNGITVFLGENGSGKTSLFSSLLDINKKKYTGTIMIDDKLLNDMSSKEIAKVITMNFQIKQRSEAYVYEMLEYARAPYKGFSMKLSVEEERLVEKAIELTGIAKFLNQRMNTLSGGERQMVYIAMSIIQNTPYMFFDEPDTYLDIENRKKLFDIINTLKNDGHTIVLSLHSIETAFSIADRIYVMKSGKIVGSINSNEFDTESLIESVFNVRKNIIYNNDEKIYVIR